MVFHTLDSIRLLICYVGDISGTNGEYINYVAICGGSPICSHIWPYMYWTIVKSVFMKVSQRQAQEYKDEVVKGTKKETMEEVNVGIWVYNCEEIKYLVIRWKEICNGYGVSDQEHNTDDVLILFIGLPEPWRVPPESWHLSRSYARIVQECIHTSGEYLLRVST